MKQPPMSINAERVVLAAMMQGYDVTVTVEDFYRKDHRLLFDAITDLRQAGKPYDHLSVSEYLDSQNRLYDAGGHAYPATLVEECPITNVEAYSRVLKEAAARRRLIQQAQAAIDAANSDAPLADIAAKLTIQDVDWQQWLSPSEQSKLRDASTYSAELKDSFLNPAIVAGHRLPWKKASDFRFRDGELTVWSGYNGSKKSMMLGFGALGFIAQGATVCIASLEMKPVTTLSRVVRQFVGVSEPTVQAMEEFFNWCRGKLWLYDQVGTVQPERMIAVARYAITALEVSHVVIDSLMKCGIAEDDYNRQKWFVDELSALAKDTNAHIHLVAHSRKPGDAKESNPSTKYSVAGSGNLTNMADNVLIVFSNKDDSRDYDAALICDKQRNGEKEPKYLLHFDERSLQFKGHETAQKLSPDDWRNCRWQ